MRQVSRLTRILYVGGQEDADRAVHLLEREGEQFEVETATGVSEGLDRFDDGVDCIVSGYELPDGDGIALLEAVRETNPHMPFVLFPGEGSERLASDAIAAGVTDYLPNDGENGSWATLADRVVDAVEQSRRRCEREAEEDRLARFVDQTLDALSDMFYVLDTDGDILRWNDRVEEVTGYEGEALEGMNALELFPEAERDRVAAAFEDVLKSGQTTVEADICTADGDHVTHEFTGARLTDVDGTAGSVVGVGRDVTRRKEHERQIERLQQMTQALMHTATSRETAQVAVETVHEVLDVQLSGVHLLGDDGETLEATAFVDTVREKLDEPPSYERGSDDPAAALVWEAYRTGETRVLDDTREHGRLAEVTPTRSGIVHPLGDHGVFIVSATEPRAFDGTDKALNEIVARSLTTALDRVQRETQLREREQQLEAERDRLNALFEMVPDPITQVQFEDGEPILLDANPAFEDTFGHEREAVVGRSANEIIVPPDGMADAEAVDERVRTDRTVKQEVRRLTDDGVGDFLFRSVPIGDPETTDEYFGIHVDISDLKSYERRLERQNERLDRFASIVSHDLRNPLNVAQGRLELAAEDCDSEHLAPVSRAHERMAELIDDLLTVAREGQRVTDVEPVALAGLVEECWRTVETAEATLVTETDATVRADRTRLRQLVENLIRNAVEHGGESVTVRVGDLGDGFFVEDDGPGIPPEERDRVVEVGYSTAEGGTGFGLGIAEQVADAHGWRLDIADGTDGGARFEITNVDGSPTGK